MGTVHARHEHRPLLQGHLQLQLGCPACRQRQGWPKKGMGLGFLFEWRCAGGLGPLSFLLLPARCLPGARRAAQQRPSAAAEPSQPAQTAPCPPHARGTPGLAQGKELALTAAGGGSCHRRCAAGPPKPNPSSKQRAGKAGWAAASARSCLRAVSEAGRGEGAYREAGIAGLDPELCQHPDAIGELQGLVEHVLALHIPLGNGEDVAALELAANGICVGAESCCGHHSGQGTRLHTSSLWTCSCPTSSSSPSPQPAMQHIQNPLSPRSEEKGSIQPGSQVLPGEGRAQSLIHKRSRPASPHKGQLAAASGTERTWLSLPSVCTSHLAPDLLEKEPGERGGTREPGPSSCPRLPALPVSTGLLPCPWVGQGRLLRGWAASELRAPVQLLCPDTEARVGTATVPSGRDIPTGQNISETANFLQLANGKQSSISFLEIGGEHRGKELSSPHSLGWDNWDKLVTSSQPQAEPSPSEGFGPTCVERTVFDLELGLVLIGNVLPSGQEHLTLCREERNQQSEATRPAAPSTSRRWYNTGHMLPCHWQPKGSHPATLPPPTPAAMQEQPHPAAVKLPTLGGLASYAASGKRLVSAREGKITSK